MNWEMLSAVGQLATVVIGIPSIIYLASQIRSQSKESRRATANVLIAHWTEFRKSLSDHADLAEIHLRGLQSFEDLNPVEKLRFGSALGRFFVLSEGLYLFYLDGALASELWKTFEQTTADFIAYPGVQSWWATRKHWHTARFRALVDRAIVAGTKPTLYEHYTERPHEGKNVPAQL
jgi:hypothetical protein